MGLGLRQLPCVMQLAYSYPKPIHCSLPTSRPKYASSRSGPCPLTPPTLPPASPHKASAFISYARGPPQRLPCRWHAVPTLQSLTTPPPLPPHPNPRHPLPPFPPPASPPRSFCVHHVSMKPASPASRRWRFVPGQVVGAAEGSAPQTLTTSSPPSPPHPLALSPSHPFPFKP